MTQQESHSITHDRPIDMIFGVLESAGYPRTLQDMLLPEWVTPDVLSDDAASSEIAAILAKRLGLRVSSLFAKCPRVESLRRRDIKYKRSLSNKSKNLTAATSIAVSVAESVASACTIEFSPFSGNAYTLREEVLSTHSGYWLGLKNLLLTCWSHGVPVVYLSRLGQGVVKMDGMVVYTSDRPVIILSKASPYWAWQLFILAHEVAHIVLGHVAPGDILVDEVLDEDLYALKDHDSNEQEADMFALELINGRWNPTYSVLDDRVNYIELANIAVKYGKKNRIDPGHIVLNFANQSGNWKLGIAAAKLLQSNEPPAWEVINQAMWWGIDSEALPMDTIEFLKKVTGSSRP